MIWLIAISSILAGSLFWIWNSLRKAPEGYENNTGFHILRKRARGSRVVAAKRPDQEAEPIATLKHIKV
jgi:hypothetical protein